MPYLFHSCFWESADVVAFILRMINKSENFNLMAPETSILKNDIDEPVEKWQRRLNRVKLRVGFFFSNKNLDFFDKNLI